MKTNLKAVCKKSLVVKSNNSNIQVGKVTLTNREAEIVKIAVTYFLIEMTTPKYRYTFGPLAKEYAQVLSNVVDLLDA